jgi:hypothetical protein
VQQYLHLPLRIHVVHRTNFPIFSSRLTCSMRVLLSTKLLPVCTVCANNRTADLHSTPDSTEFVHAVCAPLSLLMLPALYNVLRGDTDSTEYELENVLLFILWLSLLGVLSLLLKSVSIHFFLLLPWILGHWMVLAVLVLFHVRT